MHFRGGGEAKRDEFGGFGDELVGFGFGDSLDGKERAFRTVGGEGVRIIFRHSGCGENLRVSD